MHVLKWIGLEFAFNASTATLTARSIPRRIVIGLAPATIFKDIIPIVKHHHEKYDGKGYPSQLKGENIPLFARIAAVADTFDAMTSKRTYRDELPLETVIAEIERCKGTQFDPQIADVFLDILRNDYHEIEEIQEKY